MGNDAIIAVENLGKRYRLGTSRSNERYATLRDTIAAKTAGVFGKLKPGKAEKLNGESDSSVSESQRVSISEDFWALKNVSFEVREGEVVGIIGRNGAGKSTLLKILSRITEPTEGRIRIKGRVASLLEVGTGFHPELTGRENIFLNGAILGMHRHEIKAKFDEIVAFAEVEKFLDTPVKRYSSGMYVRLAFAVAAHLEPEILIVDEVLAVGDAEFQKKCLGKMQQVARGEGRTVLFVSHNISAVRSLCTSGLHLRNGQLADYSSIATVADAYLRDTTPDRSFQPRFSGPLATVFSLRGVLLNRRPVVTAVEDLPDASLVDLIFQYHVGSAGPIVCGVAVSYGGLRLFTIHDAPGSIDNVSSALCESHFCLPSDILRAGIFDIGFGVRDATATERWAWCDNLFQLNIVDNGPFVDRTAHGVLNVVSEPCHTTAA